MTIDPLALRDRTDPAAGDHAVQHVVAAIEDAVTRAWPLPLWHDPGPRVVSVTDNYDRLRYDRDAVTRDRRYTRYVGDGRMLRSHTTARIPVLLDRLAAGAEPEVLLSVPGICYRRDAIAHPPPRAAPPTGPLPGPLGGPPPAPDA